MAAKPETSGEVEIKDETVATPEVQETPEVKVDEKKTNKSAKPETSGESNYYVPGYGNVTAKSANDAAKKAQKIKDDRKKD